jgi:hypothetical protein
MVEPMVKRSAVQVCNVLYLSTPSFSVAAGFRMSSVREGFPKRDAVGW